MYIKLNGKCKDILQVNSDANKHNSILIQHLPLQVIIIIEHNYIL